MENKYCLPIIQTSAKQVQSIIAKHESSYGYFEVWLDYIQDLDEDFLRELIVGLQGRLVVVFRRQKLEPIAMGRVVRLKMLRVLDNTPVLVDLDLVSQRYELEYIRSRQMKIQIIASYHNYEMTPTTTQLRRIARGMVRFKPAISKIATYCHGEADAIRLLELQSWLKSERRRHIILGMGSHGLVTRIFGMLWGNVLAFVPEDKQTQSADGQLTRKQMEQIMAVLKG